MKLLMGKQVMAATAGGAHAPLLKSGDVKMIAVANDTRHSYAPNVKTIAEQGYGLSVTPTSSSQLPREQIRHIKHPNQSDQNCPGNGYSEDNCPKRGQNSAIIPIRQLPKEDGRRNACHEKAC